MNRDYATLTLGLFLAAIAALLLYVASRLPLVTELLQVAMLLLGLVSMAAVSTFVRYVEQSRGGPLIQITFNEAQARSALKEVTEVDALERKADFMLSAPPWEPTSDALLLQDPVLALAKLRIDIERELRRLAYSSEQSLDTRRLSIPRLMEVLVRQEVLESHVATVVNNILPACNQAIHGADIAPDVALSVSNVGAEVLRILRNLMPTPNSISH